MPANDYAVLAKQLRTDIGPKIGTMMTADEFSGETATEARRQAIKFLQQLDVTAYKLEALAAVLEGMHTSTEQTKAKGTGGGTAFLAQFDDMNELWYQASDDAKLGSRDDASQDGSWLRHDTITSIDTVADGSIQQVSTAGGETKGFADLRKNYIHSKVVADADAVFHDTVKAYADDRAAMVRGMKKLPTTEQIRNNDYHGNLIYSDSVFNHISGSFQEGDMPESFLSNATTRDGHLITGIKPSHDTPAPDPAPKDEAGPDQPSSAHPQPSPRFGSAMSGTSLAGNATGMRGGSGGRLNYAINEVDPEDIYQKIKDLYGVDAEQQARREGIDSDYVRSLGLGDTTSTTSSSYVPSTRTSSTDVSSALPSAATSRPYTPSSYTPSSYTPTSASGSPSWNTYTPTSGLTTAPRSAGATLGPRTSMPTGGGARIGGAESLAPAGRSNAATAGTGGSSTKGSGLAGASGGARGSAGGSAAGMGRGGMMPMGMMPMGHPGAGAAGGKGSTRAQVKNKDQDLYGGDINSVAPVIRAGSKAAGLPEPETPPTETKDK